MNARRVTSALALALVVLTPGLAGGFSVTNVTRVDTSGAGALAVASCQTILLANAFTGANTAESGLGLDAEPERADRAPVVTEELVTDHANASCSQHVPRVDVTIARSPSWGEAAPAGTRDASFVWHGPREAIPGTTTGPASGTPDVAANVVDVHLAANASAVAVCQLIVGVDVFIAAGPALGHAPTPEATARSLPAEKAVNATERADASCETIVHSLRVHLTH